VFATFSKEFPKELTLSMLRVVLSLVMNCGKKDRFVYLLFLKDISFSVV
jgi:hypothetical protein